MRRALTTGLEEIFLRLLVTGLARHLQIFFFFANVCQTFFRGFRSFFSISIYRLSYFFLNILGFVKIMNCVLGIFGSRVLFPCVMWNTMATEMVIFSLIMLDTWVNKTSAYLETNVANIGTYWQNNYNFIGRTY